MNFYTTWLPKISNPIVPLNMYKRLLQPLLFTQDAEKAHYLTFNLLSTLVKIPFGNTILNALYGVENSPLDAVEIAGLTFPNRIGLAAGFDKNALLLETWPSLGFGFVEIGTVTPLAQAGNPTPRLFRLKPDEAIINRMGFNNDGAAIIAQRLKNRKNKSLVIGGNLGKNKDTPNENALSDYIKSADALGPYVDYFVINISSPNTPNLRALQDKEPLAALLKGFEEHKKQQAWNAPKEKPTFLKIAPDLSFTQIDDILDLVLSNNLAGIIATNTTLSREGLLASPAEIEQIGMGGLSGKPLRNKSTAVIKHISTATEGKLPIIGVGGIHSLADAEEKLAAGATLLQLYTGYIYSGPTLPRELVMGLRR